MKEDVIYHVNGCSHVRKCENNVQKDAIPRYCHVYASLHFTQERKSIDGVAYLTSLIVKRFFKCKNTTLVDNNFYNSPG